MYSSNFRLVHECNFSFVLLLGDRSDDRKRPDATRDRSKSAAGNCFASAHEQGKFACIGKVFRWENNGVFLSFELKEGDCMYNRNEVVMY